jgi:phosphatidylglycerol:prolipoprotein diacylglycerol transferase
MTGNINFPHLGIHLKNVGQSFTVFGFEIAYYGVIIGLAVISGVLLAAYLAKKYDVNPDYVYDIAIYAVFFSVVGARLYYVIFSWDFYKKNLGKIFNLREGGLAIYGAVLAAILTVFIYTKVKKISFLKFTDIGAPALLLGQTLGRWGNFFNREAFGGYTDGLFAMQVPIDAVRLSDVTDQMIANAKVVDGIFYIQVHPTFLYESLWNLGVLLLMLWVAKELHVRLSETIYLTASMQIT